MRLRDIHFGKTLRQMPRRHRRYSIGVDGETIGVNTVCENCFPDNHVASAPAIPRCAQSIERIAHRRNGDIMMLIDKVNANFHPLDSLSSRLIASKMSAIFFIRREISPRAQASSEGTYSGAQGVAYNDGNGYLSVVYFLAQALDELAGAIDSSLPIVTGTRLQSHPL